MTKNSQKQKLVLSPITKILLALLGLFLVVGLALHIHSARKSSVSSQNAVTKSDNSAPAVSANSASNSNLKASTDIPNMPILMYHYIRDYNNSADQIGINLSVAPAKFASQLDLIQSLGYHTINFQDIADKKIPTKPIILTFDDGYIDFYQNAYPELKKRGMTAVSYVITQKIGGAYITTDMIKELSSSGIEIGSHTESHPDLTKISIPKAHEEIFGSKKFLEDLIGKPVISFCYPSGKHNDAIDQLAKSAGYDYATTTASGIANFISPFALSRYRISPTTDLAKLIR